MDEYWPGAKKKFDGAGSFRKKNGAQLLVGPSLH